MKPDDFEERARAQRLRDLPPEWRQEILSAARGVATPARPHFIAQLTARLTGLLWPSPPAWAGFAAVWLGIIAMNVVLAEKTDAVAKKSEPSSARMMMVLKEQEQILTELIEPHETPMRRQKAPDIRPRSQRRLEFLMV